MPRHTTQDRSRKRLQSTLKTQRSRRHTPPGQRGKLHTTTPHPQHTGSPHNAQPNKNRRTAHHTDRKQQRLTDHLRTVFESGHLVIHGRTGRDDLGFDLGQLVRDRRRLVQRRRLVKLEAQVHLHAQLRLLGQRPEGLLVE